MLTAFYTRKYVTGHFTERIYARLEEENAEEDEQERCVYGGGSEALSIGELKSGVR